MVGGWLAQMADLPKLLIVGEPGAVVSELEFARKHGPTRQRLPGCTLCRKTALRKSQKPWMPGYKSLFCLLQKVTRTLPWMEPCRAVAHLRPGFLVGDVAHDEVDVVIEICTCSSIKKIKTTTQYLRTLAIKHKQACPYESIDSFVSLNSRRVTSGRTMPSVTIEITVALSRIFYPLMYLTLQ